MERVAIGSQSVLEPADRFHRPTRQHAPGVGAVRVAQPALDPQRLLDAAPAARLGHLAHRPQVAVPLVQQHQGALRRRQVVSAAQPLQLAAQPVPAAVREQGSQSIHLQLALLFRRGDLDGPVQVLLGHGQRPARPGGPRRFGQALPGLLAGHLRVLPRLFVLHPHPAQQAKGGNEQHADDRHHRHRQAVLVQPAPGQVVAQPAAGPGALAAAKAIEVGGEVLGGFVAVPRLLAQAGQQDRFQLHRHVRGQAAQGGRGTGPDQLAQVRRPRREGRPARQHVVAHCSEGIKVGGRSRPALLAQ